MIDLLPNTDQEEIAGAVADFLRNELPIERLRRVDRAFLNGDRKRWPQMAELGFFGLGLEEARGGVGYSLVEELLAFREFGRFAVSPAVLASVIGARLAAEAGERDLAGRILAGVEIPGLALPWDYAGPGGPGALCTVAEGDGAAFVLLWTAERIGLWRREDITPGAAIDSLDSSLHLVRGEIAAPPLVDGGEASATLIRRATLLVSAMLVGLAEAATVESVEYTKIREQFGQPIGSFQAVKHRCADMAVRAELAWAQLRLATLMASVGAPDAAFQAHAAKLLAVEAAVKNAQANIQNHGAMAITAEIDAHIYLKRAHLFERLGGDQREQRALLMR